MPPFPVKEDSLGNAFAVHIPLKAFDIETDLFCVAFEDWTHVKRVMPGLLIFVKQIVHLPELTLKASSLSRTCRGNSVLVSGHERKFSKGYLQPVAELTMHLNENWM